MILPVVPIISCFSGVDLLGIFWFWVLCYDVTQTVLVSDLGISATAHRRQLGSSDCCVQMGVFCFYRSGSFVYTAHSFKGFRLDVLFIGLAGIYFY